jgi:hypothetical protein
VSLTLANAAEVLDHCASKTPGGGFTRTCHHAGHLSPGDLWRPEQRGRPHTVTELRRHADRIILIDQAGETYSYPTNAILATAVADPLMSVPTELVGT